MVVLVVTQSLSALCWCFLKLQEAGSPSENSRHSEAVSTQQVLFVLGELVTQQEMPCASAEKILNYQVL